MHLSLFHLSGFAGDAAAHQVGTVDMDPAASDRRVPTVAFSHVSERPETIARALAEHNIFVWSGHNYALEAARALGILESGGAVRVGPVHYNGTGEIDELIEALGVTGEEKVARGGSFAFGRAYLRTSLRSRNDPLASFDDLGFRCAR